MSDLNKFDEEVEGGIGSGKSGNQEFRGTGYEDLSEDELILLKRRMKRYSDLMQNGKYMEAASLIMGIVDEDGNETGYNPFEDLTTADRIKGMGSADRKGDLEVEENPIPYPQLDPYSRIIGGTISINLDPLSVDSPGWKRLTDIIDGMAITDGASGDFRSDVGGGGTAHGRRSGEVEGDDEDGDDDGEDGDWDPDYEDLVQEVVMLRNQVKKLEMKIDRLISDRGDGIPIVIEDQSGRKLSYDPVVGFYAEVIRLDTSEEIDPSFLEDEYDPEPEGRIYDPVTQEDRNLMDEEDRKLREDVDLEDERFQGFGGGNEELV